MKYKILVVEDSVDSQTLIDRSLSKDFELVFTQTGMDCLTLVNKDHFDLILLDVGLPDIDGYQLCAQIKNEPKLKFTPLMFITAKSSEHDKVLGFSLGADDYVTKPFNSLELNARIHAKIRSSVTNMAASNVISVGHLILYKDSQKVYSIAHGQKQEISLTGLEFKILLHLMNNVGRVLSRDQIFKAIWPNSVNVSDRTIDTHVTKLRKKLVACSNYVESVYGVGYRFAPVAKSNSAAA